MRALWRRVEPFVATKRAAAVLVLLSLLVYRVEAIAWPFERGRDAWDYMTYYASFFDTHTPFTEVMLFRTPVTPFALGIPLDIGGVTALQVTMALFFALSVLAWWVAALSYSRLAAVLVAAVLLVYPAFALSFHEASSDAIATFAFSLFALGVVRTGLRPSAARFAALGAGAGVVALTRPAYVALIAGVLVPFCVRGLWRSRLVWGSAYLVAVLVVLGSWAGLNELRYGDFTVSRLSVAVRPPRTAAPDAGPASRRLTGIVGRDVLSLPPYRRYHVTLATYFDRMPEYEWIRLLGIADRAGGIGSDFRLLREVDAEAAAAAPTRVAVSAEPRRSHGRVVSTAITIWRFLSRPANRDQTHLKPAVWPVPSPVLVRNGKSRPNPEALPPSREAIEFGFLPCASNEIARCILADPSEAYADPQQARRYAEVTRTVSEWDKKLGTGHPNRWLALQLDRVTRHSPPPWVWLGIAGVALGFRRTRGGGALVALVGLAVAVLFVHAWAIGYVEAYAYPVLPALVFAGICAAVGARRT